MLGAGLQYNKHETPSPKYLLDSMRPSDERRKPCAARVVLVWSRLRIGAPVSATGEIDDLTKSASTEAAARSTPSLRNTPMR